jgi:polar amino acid transport system substrate-binding protein
MKKLLGLLVVAALISGCASVAPDPSILRVGVSPDSQPIIFKQGGAISGIEASFAEKLGAGLGRRVVFVEVPWKKQIETLEQNKTDIIMSGMTVTAARNIRVNFAVPYLRSGLTGLFRRDAYNAKGLVASLAVNQMKGIGYVKNTSGEFFVMKNFSAFDKKGYSTAKAAAKALKKGKINIVIHDAPMLWQIFAENETALVAFPEFLNAEPLAWAMRKGDLKLLDEVNTQLKSMDEDGTRERVIKNWIPALNR